MVRVRGAIGSSGACSSSRSLQSDRGDFAAELGKNGDGAVAGADENVFIFAATVLLPLILMPLFLSKFSTYQYD